MSVRVSIFKKIAFDKYIPQYTGEYPIELDKFTQFDLDWVDDFKKKYQEKLRNSHNQGSYTAPFKNTASYVMYGNGQLDELPNHHAVYINRVKDDIVPEYNYGSHVDNDKHYRYKRQSDFTTTYELIHHLFNGGIRVYVDDGYMTLTAYQIPNDNQLKMIHEIYNKLHIIKIRIELNLNKKLPHGASFFDHNTFEDFDDFNNYIHSLKSKSTAMTPEKRQKIEMLQRFRNQAEEPKLNKEVPRRPRRPIPQQTQTPIGTLNEQLVKNINWPSGNKFKMPAIANTNNLIKIAEYLDKNNRFEESDLIMNILDYYLRKNNN